MKWILRLTWTVLALLAVAMAVLAGYAWRASPHTEGRLVLQGARADMQIERDVHGIPTIRAASAADAYFGLGVVHAQDRLWQLETHRRIGSGRLAEAFGEGALETDRFLRALGVRRAAAAQWERTTGEAREALQAYAAGINAVLKQGMGARPPEFLILGVQPEDWGPVDSLAWAIMMAWDLGGNWSAEMQRMRLALNLPLQRVNELIPPYPGEAVPATRDYGVLYRDLEIGKGRKLLAWSRLLESAPPSGIEGTGSNNWVVSGARSATGRPLLANDPHLKLSAPALWYLARLEAPGLKVAGATMPGLPVVVLGQNEHAAWGFTNTGPDVQDLYIERTAPGEPLRVQTPQGWSEFEVVQEVIRVKGKSDVRMAVRIGRHGPVISDAGTLDDVVGPKSGAPDLALALRWTALDPDADPVGVGLQIMRAASVDEYFKASERWVAPMQSMVVADRSGRIGMIAPGRVPLRGPGHDLRGLAPAPGWDARYDWAGWVPSGQTPRETDPARGWIATANHRIVGPDYPHYLGSDWALPYRQQRIESLLQARDKHSLDDLARVQADQVSLAARPLLPWLTKARPSHPLADAARRQLEGFDGTMDAMRAAPLIYWSWVRHLTRGLLADEIGEQTFDKLFGNRTFRDAVEAIVAREDAWWCDDKTTPAMETCAQVNDRALAAALDELSARFGTDPAAWRWGDAHQMRAEHRPFSKVKALAPLFELRTPVGGDTYTVNASRVSLKAPVASELYFNEHGPSLRALYDVADPLKSRVMHSSGQSGLPWAAGYRSFVQRWRAVEYVPLWPAAGASGEGGRLVVSPGP